jgi:DNA-directed RNA polymerase subunit M/transcription elongation factor TFIIS
LSSSPPSSDLPGDQKLNVACPHCGAQFGHPTSVATRRGDSGKVDVRLSCRTCNHSWIVQKLTHDDPPA